MTGLALNVSLGDCEIAAAQPAAHQAEPRILTG
jgi:hypothetical protein